VFVEDDPIPVLTDTLEITETQALEASEELKKLELELELDLDPYYTATFHPESAHHQEEDSASLAFEAMDHPSFISEEITFSEYPQIESEIPDLNTYSVEQAEPSVPLQITEENTHPENLAQITATEPEAPQKSSEISTKESQAQISDSLSEQILRSIDLHLQKTIEKSVAPQLANSLDKALSSMLDQFSMHIEEMVRETIALELQKQLSAMLDVSTDTVPTSTTPNNSAHSGDSV